MTKVLIPFISGLDCYVFRCQEPYGHRSLNPFYFRAGLLRTASQETRLAHRLNPFYFRAGLLPTTLRNCCKPTCLNPFYFRAGLLPGNQQLINNFRSLNPFYFRAGLLRTVDVHIVAPNVVLIPFISGLDCYRSDAATLPLTFVLIPFISGLDCYRTTCG